MSDRMQCSELEARHLTDKLEQMLSDAANHPRDDVGKITDPRAQTLFESNRYAPKRPNQKESIFHPFAVRFEPNCSRPRRGRKSQVCEVSLCATMLHSWIAVRSDALSQEVKKSYYFWRESRRTGKSAHSVIGSGFHSGRIGTSLLLLSGCFAIHSGRTVMPRPSRANGRLMPGSLVTT